MSLINAQSDGFAQLVQSRYFSLHRGCKLTLRTADSLGAKSKKLLLCLCRFKANWTGF
jgi:hypothetical protein